MAGPARARDAGAMTCPLPPAAPPPDPAILLCRALPASTAGAPPEWLLLAPAGVTQGRDGRSFRLDDPEAVVARFTADGDDIPLDWEHATHLRAPQGLDAPAAGWITALQVRDGALWGRVAWTADGAAAVSSRAYRFYSPAFYLDAQGAIVAIPSVGLTSKPNLRVPALNARPAPRVDPPSPDSETSMSLPAPLTTALGLPADAALDAALVAIQALQAPQVHRATPPDLNLYVPRADHEAALHRAAQAESALQETLRAELDRQVETLLQEGLAAARLTPATLDYHRAQAQTPGGLERLRQYLALAPSLLAAAPRGTPPEGDPALNQQQAAIAAAFGNSPETLAQFGDRP